MEYEEYVKNNNAVHELCCKYGLKQEIKKSGSISYYVPTNLNACTEILRLFSYEDNRNKVVYFNKLAIANVNFGFGFCFKYDESELPENFSTDTNITGMRNQFNFPLDEIKLKKVEWLIVNAIQQVKKLEYKEKLIRLKNDF